MKTGSIAGSSARPPSRRRTLVLLLTLAGLVRLACAAESTPATEPRAEGPPAAPAVVVPEAAPASPPAAPPSAPATVAPVASTPPPPAPDKPEPQRFTLFVSNEQAGELEPCGCAEGQLGGLPRRASLLASLRARDRAVIVADNGDLVVDGGLQSQQKLETTLQAHQLMGTAALTLGELDLLLDPDTLSLTALNFAVPLVSANVKPVSRTHVVQDVATDGGSVRVGLTGFLDPQLVTQAQPGWQVLAPAEPLAAALTALGTAADVTVVLAHATAARAETILRDLPAPDLVIVAHEAEDPLEPVPTILRGVPALAPGTQAKYLARVDVTVQGGRARVAPAYFGLDEKIPDLPAVRALLDGYQDILKQLNIADLTPRQPYAAGGTYTGPDRCAACHTSAAAVWADSRHAHAMDSLVERKHEFDPDCLVCHSTGFSYVGGYMSRAETPALAYVSCESCHGPGSNHADDPGPGYGKVNAPRFCMTCHDAPNSPHFDLAEYWPRIAHGHD